MGFPALFCLIFSAVQRGLLHGLAGLGRCFLINLRKGKWVNRFMLDLIHAYENYLTKVRKASGNTVSSYLRDIRQFASWLEQGGKADILQTTREDVVDYFAYLYQQGKSGATASRSLASMRNFFAYLQSTGFLETSPITSDVHVDRGEKRLPQILTGKGQGAPGADVRYRHSGNGND